MKQPKLLVLFTLLMSMMNTQAFAAKYQVANADGVMIYYTLINENELEVSYQDDEYHYYPDRYSGNVVIPASVNINGKTYSVKRIGYEAFRGCSKLTSVTLPSSITYISQDAFHDCSGLTSITLTAGLSEGISNYAFQNCTSLTSVIIPDGTTWLGAGAFQGCSSLATISIPNSVTLIGISALDGTAWFDNQPDGLVYAGKVAYKYKGVMPDDYHLVIENGTLGIANSAFNYSNNTQLTSVIIPSSITYIGTSAFYGCNSLVSVTMRRKTPVNIDSYTFSNRANAILYVPAGSKAAYESADNWKEFKEIVELSPIIEFADANVKALCVANWDTDGDEELSETEAAAVTELGIIFRENTNITSFNELQFFTGLTSIGNYSFQNCTRMTSISIPNSVTNIGDAAFQYCSNLTNLTIPSSVTSIGVVAFFGCYRLASVTIPYSVNSIGGGAFNFCTGLTSLTVAVGNTRYDSRDNCNAIIESASNTLISGCKSTIIPSTVTSIGDGAFAHSNLSDVNIPNSVISIGNSAFSGCTNLSSLTLPNSVTSVGWEAFNSCSNLINVVIGNSVTSIGYDAFESCSQLASVIIPKSVTSLGAGAFNGCYSLISVTVEREEPISLLDTYTFSNCANATLFVPVGSKAAYKAKDYWKDFKEIIEVQQCATPTINLVGGKLHFECETEGVEFHYEFTTPASGNGTGNDVDISSTYVVNVYASKDGYTDSDVATANVDVAGIKGDVDGDGIVDIADAVHIVNYIVGKVNNLAPRKDNRQSAVH